MTVEQLLDQMTARELTEWLAFYRVEPFGESWRQTAAVCTMIGNAAGGKSTGGKFSISDFLPIRPLLRHTAGRIRQTGEQILAVFRALTPSSSSQPTEEK